MPEQFLIIREEWNRYKLLHDNTELRIKLPLVSMKVEKKDTAGGTGALSFTQIFFKEETPEDTGPPSHDQSITEQDVVEEIKFESIIESVNIYDFPSIKNLLVCRPSLVKITRTNKFDANGKRMYQYETRMSIASVQYPPPLPTNMKEKEPASKTPEPLSP
jgi:hypothetical protein